MRAQSTTLTFLLFRINDLRVAAKLLSHTPELMRASSSIPFVFSDFADVPNCSTERIV